MYKDEIMYDKTPKQTSKTLEDLPKIIKENTEEINCKQRARKRVRHRAKSGISLPVIVEVKAEKDIKGMKAKEVSCKQRAGYRIKSGISLPVMAEVKEEKDIEGMKLNKINCKEKTYKFKLVNGLPVIVEVKDDGTDFKQKPRHRDKLVMTEITDDKPKKLAVSKEGQDKEEEKRVKFENLVKFLETVPEEEASEDEKKLMDIFDNDMEEQLRIQKIIEKRRRLNAQQFNSEN